MILVLLCLEPYKSRPLIFDKFHLICSYYGDNIYRSWVSYGNYIAVYLFSDGPETAKGFNGTARLVTQAGKLRTNILGSYCTGETPVLRKHVRAIYSNISRL